MILSDAFLPGDSLFLQVGGDQESLSPPAERDKESASGTSNESDLWRTEAAELISC